MSSREVAWMLAVVLLLVPVTGCLDGGEDLSPATTNPTSAEPQDVEEQTPEDRTSADNESQTVEEEAENATENATDAGPEWDPLSNVTITDDDRLELEVPLHVVMLGFPASTADALADRLGTIEVDHRTYDNPALVHLDDSPPNLFPDRTTRPNPILPVANVTVHHLPGLASDLFEKREAWAVEGTGGEDTIYEAGEVEIFLADRLASQGVPVEQAPTLVLLHDGTPGDHAYRYDYPTGYLEPVRAFGGNTELLGLDLSAREDPWVVFQTPACEAVEGADTCVFDQEPMNQPQQASGERTLEALEQATETAAHFRLLQGPLYPPTTEDCYAITAVVGVEQTALNEHAPATASVEDLLDEAKLRSVFANVTGPIDVRLDVRYLRLPQDDPGLDAVAETENSQALRTWLTENWSDYWVSHDGCEAVVSFHLFGDADETRNWGVAMHDAERGYRVSLSFTAGLERFTRTYEGPGSQATDEDPARPSYERVNQLLAHETGHLLGLRHPHDVSANGDEPNDTLVWTFSSTQTSMSYQTRERISGFGEIDRDNLLRNRAGELARLALEEDRRASLVFEEALASIGDRDWVEANEKLDSLVTPEP